MKYSSVIHDAWDLTLARPKLKWFIFVPSFAAVLVFAIKIAWQVYNYSVEFELIETSSTLAGLKDTADFLRENGLIGWTIALVLLVFLFEYVLNAWIQATLILSIQSHFNKPDKSLSLRQKMIDGLYYFFKLFKLHAITGPFHIITVLLVFSTLFRHFHGTEMFSIFIPFVIFYLIIAFAGSLFFAFSPYYIICEGEKVKGSLKKSIELVFLNIETTLGLILIMFLVNLRIVVNVLVILGIPLAIIGVISFFSASKLLTLALILTIGASLFLVGLAAYLTAVVEVFSTGVWERSFKRLREKQEEHKDENRTDDWAAE